ncbi:MAG: hypothetical protein AN483_06885 [Aphanizomenon flos-aquae MDT14a]|jgi:hypothetical protein|nr:MAG: hypothetical protein AN483_06885 [Aphanizomenon flos-aquae MDT14a]
MPQVKLNIGFWNGFVPSAPERSVIEVERKLHYFPQSIYVCMEVQEWKHPPGVGAYIHTLDDEGKMLDCQHGNCAPGSFAGLRGESYNTLIDCIPEIKDRVDSILSQMEGRYFDTYKDHYWTGKDYHNQK